jgi:6-phosphogluconolactonase
VFSVHPGNDDDQNHLVYLGQTLTYGKIPRHFSLSKDPKTTYAAVANAVSNGLVILERDEVSGFITGLRGNISLGPFDVTQDLGPAAVI